MKLRKYQERVRSQVFSAWGENKRVVAVLPTGAGKTVTGASIVKSAVEKGHSVLWVAHRTELLEQASETIKKVAGCDVGMISAVHPSNPSAPVQVASIQTLIAGGQKLNVGLLVADECHHMADGAPEWAKAVAQYGDIHWLGLTATPERGDGSGLSPLWGAMVEGASYSELLTLGQLIPCRLIRAESADSALAMSPVSAYLQHAHGQSCVVYTSTVLEAQSYSEKFRDAGVTSECVHGSMSDEDRRAALDRFAKGETKVLTNVYILTEGWDCPRASVCILARGCGSAGMLLQIAGRVMRPDPSDPNKKECLFIDLTGATEAHGHPQADRSYSLEGKAIEVKERKEKAEREKAAKEKQKVAEKENRAILERGLVEMEPLSVEAHKEWLRLQEVCRRQEFSVVWAQKQFQNGFGSKPPANWIDSDMKALEFRRLQKDASNRGFRPGWAAYRYKSAFGEWPSGFRAFGKNRGR